MKWKKGVSNDKSLATLQVSPSSVSLFVVCSLFFSWTECAGEKNDFGEKLQVEGRVVQYIDTLQTNMQTILSEMHDIPPI